LTAAININAPQAQDLSEQRGGEAGRSGRIIVAFLKALIKTAPAIGDRNA
jgi:hypothetical protein